MGNKKLKLFLSILSALLVLAMPVFVFAQSGSVPVGQPCKDLLSSCVSGAHCDQSSMTCVADSNSSGSGSGSGSSGNTYSSFSDCLSNTGDPNLCCESGYFPNDPSCSPGGLTTQNPPANGGTQGSQTGGTQSTQTGGTQSTQTGGTQSTQTGGTQSTQTGSAGTTFDCGTGYVKDPSGVCIPDSGPKTGFAGQTTLAGLIAYIIKVLLTFSGMVAVIILVYGGYLYITAAGNEERAEKGRKALTNAIIGLVLVALSYAIVTIVVNFVVKGPPVT